MNVKDIHDTISFVQYIQNLTKKKMRGSMAYSRCVSILHSLNSYRPAKKRLYAEIRTPRGVLFL